MSLHLHGLGHFHPENEITNHFLEELDIGTSESWIMERVGIRSRRTTLPLDYIRTTRNQDVRAACEAATVSNAEMAEHAARMAIARAGILTTDISMVLAGSSASDTTSPAEACNVARRLGLEVPALDVNSACTSFFASLYLLSLMKPSTLPGFVLVVVAEALTKTVSYLDRASAVLWGDGACAAVISTTEPAAAQILEVSLASSPSCCEKVVVPRVGFFRQDGPSVQKFAIQQTVRCYRNMREGRADPRLGFVGHQANLRVLETVCRYCEIPDEHHYSNVESFGNTAGAGSASVLSQRWEELAQGPDFAVIGVGAGLTWSNYLLRFLSA
jgi:3-oxoacyl-[acyl-carrier-protein] synthase-3